MLSTRQILERIPFSEFVVRTHSSFCFLTFCLFFSWFVCVCFFVLFIVRSQYHSVSIYCSLSHVQGLWIIYCLNMFTELQILFFSLLYVWTTSFVPHSHCLPKYYGHEAAVSISVIFHFSYPPQTFSNFSYSSFFYCCCCCCCVSYTIPEQNKLLSLNLSFLNAVLNWFWLRTYVSWVKCWGIFFCWEYKVCKMVYSDSVDSIRIIRYRQSRKKNRHNLLCVFFLFVHNIWL